jgi:peptide/nickel transport system substrate-binding protein
MAAYLAICIVIAASAGGCDGCSRYRRDWKPPPDPELPQAAPAATAATAPQVTGRARRGHTLRIHVDSDPKHFNPAHSPTLWTQRITSDTVFESLIRYEPPEGGAGAGPGTFAPGLAASWSIAAGGREIRIELQPDVTFHDGQKLTSMDVQYTLEQLSAANGPSPYFHQLLTDIEGVDLATARGVRIRLKRPNGYVLRALAEVPILPEHVYRARLKSTRGPPVGTGPYRFRFHEDDLVRLERYDGYWGTPPAVPTIEFVYQPDAKLALTAAKRGELDFVPELIPAHFPDQLSAPGLAQRFEPIELRPAALRYMALNLRTPALADVRVRRALTLLIDRKELSKTVYRGLRRPAAGPVWPGGPGDGPAPAPPPYDPGEAFRLLDAAGWRDTDGDRWRERHGERLKLSLLATEEDDPERERIVENLRIAGITVDIRTGQGAYLMRLLEAGDFDLALLDWTGMVDDDLSPLVETGGSANFGAFGNPRVDAAIAALREVWEPASRAPAMGELAAALAESVPLVPITRPEPHGLIHKRVQGAVVWNGWVVLRRLSLIESPE